MYFIGSDHHQRPDSDQHFQYRQHQTCSQGHTSSLILQTLEGGSICLVCLSNLISNPNSPTVHVSYALSQLSHAISQPSFLHSLLTFHPHFLISPLMSALSSIEDEPLAKQMIDVIYELCTSGDCSIYSEFVARVSDRLSSGSLYWSQRQTYMLHCLGVLLDNQKNDPYSHIKDKDALLLNLVTGLQLPSEEIQGEILFVLYKICSIQHACIGNSEGGVLYGHSLRILYLSLEILLKSHRDDVRLNCVGFFENAFENDVTFSLKEYPEADNFMETTEHELQKTPLNLLFAEAIKAPLLSSDCEVQTATLDLIALYLSCGGVSEKEVQVLVEENIADYVFEILRLLGCKNDSLVSSSLQVLDLLSVAEVAFKQRLAIGFTTLVPVLRHVAEVPFHPAQSRSIKLISECVSNCPGIISSSNVEEINLVMTGMLKKHIDGEANMLPETFTMVCSVLVALMKSPSSHGTPSIAISLQDISRYTIATCLSSYREHSFQMLHSLYLLKEAYEYSFEGNPTNSIYMGLRDCILNICEAKLLPWISMSINEIDVDIALGVLEIFHTILLHSDFQPKEFVHVLVSSSWFSFSFGCLGLFPTERMKWRVYFLLSSILDVLLGNDSGQSIRDVALHLPFDPIDLLFLLGQKGSHNQEVFCCQSAILLILYTSSLYDDRGLAKINYQIPYSPEAESTLFYIVAEKQCELLFKRIHTTSLKWLFQQERICKYLSSEVLRWCRHCIVYGNQIVDCNDTETVKFRELAELVASGDNYAAKLLVCLLRELVEESGQKHDIVLLLNTIAAITALFPAASGQLSLNEIAFAIQDLYNHVHDILPGIENAQSLLDSDNRKQQSLSYISIHCHDLSRLLHFGSSPVKLVSSYCLLQVFQRITEEKRKESGKVTHHSHHIRSMTSILDGLIFHSDTRVAMNCALCIAMIEDWEKHDKETQVVKRDNWYRLITEEMVMTLAVPKNLASKSIMIHHMPAAHIAVSMLKLQQVPPWISVVFDDSCISGIIQNLSPSNITHEMVMLFRELLHSGYLESKHIACLNQLFQACRKRVYSDDIQDSCTEDTKNSVIFPDDPGKVYEASAELLQAPRDDAQPMILSCCMSTQFASSLYSHPAKGARN
ncbi:Armadillo-type fold [Cynara cardunculus var. scolymus]|uniref:Armadillo-type fold n=1 Tax=Cynara cardunculus var. scolymus TaxID=59895 RepID=A0A103Y8L6_CYNCS|nr:Armadillo-type fold [Cynara cardunculus var. scolymus]